MFWVTWCQVTSGDADTDLLWEKNIIPSLNIASTGMVMVGNAKVVIMFYKLLLVE